MSSVHWSEPFTSIGSIEASAPFLLGLLTAPRPFQERVHCGLGVT